MCFRKLRNLCGVSPHTPAGTSSLHPFCGWSGGVVQTLCRRSRNILIQKGRKTANLQCINTLLPILNSCTNEILHSSFFILNLSHPPRAGGVPPPAGCCASGENEKRRRENTFSRPSFFTFSLCPWGLFRSCLSELSVSKQFFVVHDSAVLSPSGRKCVRASIQPLRLLGAGRNSLPWGTGAA